MSNTVSCELNRVELVSDSVHRSRLVVGIATRRRPSVLTDTLAIVQSQSRPPDSIYISYVEESDVSEARLQFPALHYLEAPAGLTRQRNRILDEVESDDVLVFLDDDFHLHRDFLFWMETVFCDHPRVVAATGQVLADGINGPGLTAKDAAPLLQRNGDGSRHIELKPVFNAYGCNMAVRLHPVREASLRFDERLPLYGWYEDVEFCRQLAPFGQIVRVDQAMGVHLGSKSGRQSGRQLGYSQVANPFYLARKKRVSWLYACASMLSRTSKNLYKSIRPEPWVDRRGRLQGNLQGWMDMMRGTLDPMKVMTFATPAANVRKGPPVGKQN
jgi:GT2 family glycosyltransferase